MAANNWSSHRDGLFFMPLTLLDHKCSALVDSGASDSFISVTLAHKLGVKLHALKHPMSIRTANGDEEPCSQLCETSSVVCGTLAFRACLRVIRMVHDVILGFPFLARFDPAISWRSRTMQIWHRGKRHDVALLDYTPREKKIYPRDE